MGEKKDDRKTDEIPVPVWVHTLRKRMKELKESGFLQEVMRRD